MSCKYCQCDGCARERNAAHLSDSEAESSRRLAVIVALVVKSFGVSEDGVRGRRRDLRTARARQVVFYLVRTLTGYTYPRIGFLFNRDHSTVIHAVQIIEKAMERPEFKRLIDGYIAQIVKQPGEDVAA